MGRLDKAVECFERLAVLVPGNATVYYHLACLYARQNKEEQAVEYLEKALAAGYDKLLQGLAVAKRHGYRFGGSMHIMHDEAFWINFYQYRLMEDIAKDIVEWARK